MGSLGGMVASTVLVAGMAVTQIYNNVTQPDAPTPPHASSDITPNVPSEESVSPEAVGAVIVIKQHADYLLGPSLMGPSMGKR